jgi:hypothetical protein
MVVEAPVRASATRRSAAVVSAASASRLLLGQRHFLVPSASCSLFVVGRAAVSSPAAGLRPRLRKLRISVVAMAGNGEYVCPYGVTFLNLWFFLWTHRCVALVTSGCANIRRTDGVCGNDQDNIFVELWWIIKKHKAEKPQPNREGFVSKEFTEFCKALWEHLSVEDMHRILQANGQDTSGSEDAVVSRWY